MRPGRCACCAAGHRERPQRTRKAPAFHGWRRCHFHPILSTSQSLSPDGKITVSAWGGLLARLQREVYVLGVVDVSTATIEVVAGRHPRWVVVSRWEPLPRLFELHQAHDLASRGPVSFLPCLAAVRRTPPPNPQPPPRNGEGEKKRCWLACSPSPLRGGGWGEGFSEPQLNEGRTSRIQRAFLEDVARPQLEAAPRRHRHAANRRPARLGVDEYAVLVARQVIRWRHVPQHHVRVGDLSLLGHPARQVDVILLTPLIRRHPKVEVGELVARGEVPRRPGAVRDQLIGHGLALRVLLGAFDADARELVSVPHCPALDALVERLDNVLRSLSL